LLASLSVIFAHRVVHVHTIIYTYRSMQSGKIKDYRSSWSIKYAHARKGEYMSVCIGRWTSYCDWWRRSKRHWPFIFTTSKAQVCILLFIFFIFFSLRHLPINRPDRLIITTTGKGRLLDTSEEKSLQLPGADLLVYFNAAHLFTVNIFIYSFYLNCVNYILFFVYIYSHQIKDY